jgi:DNA-binding NtrC family response regulator
MSRILVIDDDEIVNDMIVQMLTEVGYDVEGALDGNKGLKLLAARPFDLVITDIVMPEKEGLETIMAILKLNKELPIIAISGGGRIGAHEHLKTAKTLGANHTIQKPFDRASFLGTVQECLS